MRKAILSAATAAAVGLVGLTAAPQPAHAFAWWVIPAIVGGVVVGAGVGAATADVAARPAYPYRAARGEVYVRPYCHIERTRWRGGWRDVRVCD